MRISPLKVLGGLCVIAAIGTLKSDTSPRQTEMLKEKSKIQQTDSNRYNRVLEQAKTISPWKRNKLWKDEFIKMKDSLRLKDPLFQEHSKIFKGHLKSLIK